MIRINLLPEELRQIERARRIRVNVTFFAGIVVAGAVIVLVGAFYVIGRRMRRLAEMRERLTELTPRSEEARALVKKERRLSKEIKMMDDFSTGRILWNRHLNTVSDCMPEALFLTGLNYRNRTPFTLVIKGEAPASEGSEMVVSFIDNLRKTAPFISEFPQMSYFIENLPEGRQAFEIRCTRPKK